MNGGCGPSPTSCMNHSAKKRIISLFLVVALLGHTVVAAAEDGKAPSKVDPKAEDGAQMQPPTLLPKSNAEYYSSKSDAKVLVPVSVWGDVALPGVHFLPIGSKLGEVLSSAGGPTATASVPEITVVRGSQSLKYDIFDGALHAPLRPGDVVYVQRSLKADLPLYISGVTALVSMATLYWVTAKKR